MDNSYCPLPERIAEQFEDMDNDISMDLSKNSEKYAELINKIKKLKAQNPFISEVLDGKGEVNLSGEEHETLKGYFRLYMQADSMEREQIYFRGHTDSFAYFKKIGAL